MLARLPQVSRVSCDRYTEIFNRRQQSFRLQKRRPAMILAAKREGFVLDVPTEYGFEGYRNYYFSHLLNCPYDCRYCFLQGMYRSAAYVLFVNYEDFMAEIEARTAAAVAAGTEAFFFSGYDCDSLAFEGLTGFAESFLPFFEKLEGAWLELRTKSVHIAPLVARPAFDRCVVAWSLSPPTVWRSLEHRTPSPQRRLEAMVRLQSLGWRIALRLDPLVPFIGFEEEWKSFLGQVFERLQVDSLHSVGLGVFRMPRDFHRRLVRLYPREPLLAAPMEETGGVVSYDRETQWALVDFCRRVVLEHVPEERVFTCLTP